MAIQQLVPAQPTYTWTFSRKSLLIRYYLWLYQADEKSLNFCKLFWGMVSTPITLPIRLLIGMIMLIGAVAGLVGTAVAYATKVPRYHISKALDGIAAYQNAKDTARARRMKEFEERRYQEAIDRVRLEAQGNAIMAMNDLPEQGPRPSKPSIPSKVSVAIANAADRWVAYFQARPQIGQTFNEITTWIGRVFVRFVFYPLMIVLPLAVFAWLGLQIDLHYLGLLSGLSTMFWDPVHAIGAAGLASWAVVKYIVFTVVAGIAMAAIMVAMFWLIVVSDKFMAALEQKSLAKGRVKMADYFARDVGDLFTPRAEGPIYAKAKDVLDRRFVPHAQTLGHGFMKVGGAVERYTIAPVARTVFKAADRTFDGVAHGGVAIGHGFRDTGRFFVLGHHSLKSRTCPAIRIED